MEPRGFTPLLSFALQNAQKSIFEAMISPGSNPLWIPFVIVANFTPWVDLPKILKTLFDLMTNGDLGVVQLKTAWRIPHPTTPFMSSMRWSERLAALFVTFHEIPPS